MIEVEPTPAPRTGPAVSEDAAIDRLLALAARLESEGVSPRAIWSAVMVANARSPRPLRLAEIETVIPRPTLPEPRARRPRSGRRVLWA